MIEVGVREFYQEMVDHPDVYPKSSMPSVQDYVDAFLPFVKAEFPSSASVSQPSSAAPCSLL